MAPVSGPGSGPASGQVWRQGSGPVSGQAWPRGSGQGSGPASPRGREPASQQGSGPASRPGSPPAWGRVYERGRGGRGGDRRRGRRRGGGRRPDRRRRRGRLRGRIRDRRGGLRDDHEARRRDGIDRSVGVGTGRSRLRRARRGRPGRGGKWDRGDDVLAQGDARDAQAHPERAVTGCRRGRAVERLGVPREGELRGCGQSAAFDNDPLADHAGHGRHREGRAGRGRLDRRIDRRLLVGIGRRHGEEGNQQGRDAQDHDRRRGPVTEPPSGWRGWSLGAGALIDPAAAIPKRHAHRLLRQPGWLCEPRGFAAPPRDGCASSWIAPASDQRLPIEYSRRHPERPWRNRPVGVVTMRTLGGAGPHRHRPEFPLRDPRRRRRWPFRR